MRMWGRCWVRSASVERDDVSEELAVSRFLYWVLSRGFILLGAVVLVFALATDGVVRAIGFAAVVLVGVVGVLAVVSARRRLFAAGEEPEPLGRRPGWALFVADSAVLLALALVPPVLDIARVGSLSAVPLDVPVVKALALVTVASAWWRVAHAGRPTRAAEVVHPLLVIAVAIAVWFIVDLVVPSRSGVEQAALSVLIAVGGLLLVLAVSTVAARRTRGTPWRVRSVAR